MAEEAPKKLDTELDALGKKVDAALDDATKTLNEEITKSEHEKNPDEAIERLNAIASRFSECIDAIGERLEQCLTALETRLDKADGVIAGKQEKKTVQSVTPETKSEPPSELTPAPEPLLKGEGARRARRVDWI